MKVARSRYSRATREEAAVALSMMACSRAGFGYPYQYVEDLCDDPEAGELAATAFETVPFVRARDDAFASDPTEVHAKYPRPLAGGVRGGVLTNLEAYAEAEAWVRDGWEPSQRNIDDMRATRSVEGDW